MDNYLTALGDIKESVISVFHARCVSDSAILNTVNCNLFMSVYNYWYCNLFGWLLVLSSPVSLLIIIDAFFPSLICVSPLFLNYPYFLMLHQFFAPWCSLLSSINGSSCFIVIPFLCFHRTSFVCALDPVLIKTSK